MENFSRSRAYRLRFSLPVTCPVDARKSVVNNGVNAGVNNEVNIPVNIAINKQIGTSCRRRKTVKTRRCGDLGHSAACSGCQADVACLGGGR